ncbi:MAG: PQQ-dependent sugar dehydrogenase [Vicinamibacteria bacterium]
MRPVLRILFRGSIALIGLGALAVATRQYWVPERFAVNVPVRALTGAAPDAASMPKASSLNLPPGFALTRFATGLNNARFLRVTERGDVLVSQPREGKVTLLFSDATGDGAADGAVALLTTLDRPHGMALRDGYLYVAEMTAVGRIRFDATSRKTSGTFERVITGLPSGGNHWTRTIGFGPDGFLYVSVGSSCNVCIEKDARRAAILRYDPATWKGSIFAGGLRNSVGLAWRRTLDGESELIATDNGRDLLGNDFPPCELNRVVSGGFYGWPFANGDRVKDPDLGAGHENEIAASLPPIHKFAAHNAPLGIAFLDAPSTPTTYRGAALVALHGSWNRTSKDGYKVVSLHWEANGAITQRDFLTGFLKDENVSGRPVDIAQAPDGTIYISDDYDGSVYRVTFGQPALSSPGAAAPATKEAGAPAPGSTNPDRTAIERGAKVWEANRCETCHDEAIIGKTPVKTAKILQKLPARYNTDKLVVYLRAPQPPMPLFEMSDQERLDLAAYVLNRFR